MRKRQQKRTVAVRSRRKLEIEIRKTYANENAATGAGDVVEVAEED
jgi:hypothetical protein